MRAMLDCGVDRTIIGTRAFADPNGLKDLVGEFGSRLAVGIDARDGFVQVKGWAETTECRALELAAQASEIGVSTLIYTDTATDGMLQGHNVAATNEMCRSVSCDVIASGGISSADDVRALSALGHSNLKGAIVGKALYDGIVTLEELLATASNP